MRAARYINENLTRPAFSLTFRTENAALLHQLVISHEIAPFWVCAVIRDSAREGKTTLWGVGYGFSSPQHTLSVYPHPDFLCHRRAMLDTFRTPSDPPTLVAAFNS